MKVGSDVTEDQTEETTVETREPVTRNLCLEPLWGKDEFWPEPLVDVVVTVMFVVVKPLTMGPVVSVLVMVWVVVERLSPTKDTVPDPLNVIAGPPLRPSLAEKKELANATFPPVGL